MGQFVECTYCNYGSKQKSNVNRHMDTCHPRSNKRKYACKACNFASNRKDGFQQHSKTNTHKRKIAYNNKQPIAEWIRHHYQINCT